MATIPYVSSFYERKAHDNSQAAGRLSDLIRTRADVQARGIAQQGDISSQMWGNLGRTVGGTLSQLATEAMNAPKRKLEERRIADEMKARDDAERFQMLEKDTAQMGMGPEDRIKTYEQQGFRPQAEAAREQWAKQRADTLRLASEEFKQTQERLSQASQLLRGVSLGKTPEQQAAQYASVLPKVREYVGPELGKQLPDVYDPNVIAPAIAWGEQARDTLYWQQYSASMAAEAVNAEKDKERSLDYWNKALSAGLSVAKTPEQWKEWQEYAKRAKAPESVLSRFGDFSPENVKKAMDYRNAVDNKADKPNSDFQQVLNAYIRDNGEPTADKIIELRDRWEKAGPQRAATGGTTASSRGVAIRARDAELRRIAAAGMTSEEAEAARQLAWDSFYEATGDTPEPGLTVERPIGEPRDGPLEDRPEPPQPLSNLVKPAPAAPATGRPGIVPFDVAKALKGQKPGVYTGEDGTRWRVAADGSITPVQ